MVMAKLHIICGNCGSSDSFENKTSEEFTGNDDEYTQMQTRITCKNCSTIHWIDDNSKNMNELKESNNE